MNKKIEKIAIVGGGFMGIQIAIVAAKFAGNMVKVYDINPGLLRKPRKSGRPFYRARSPQEKSQSRIKPGSK